MDFFQAQEAARRRTRVLILLFVLAVAAITVAVYFLVFVVLAFSARLPPAGPLFIQVAIITPLFIMGAAAFRTHKLRRGGAAVAEMLGGVRIDPASTDPAERRLVNVVEEMAIASGMPVPGIFLLPEDAAVNAFAAGFTLDDAVIGVTKGAIDTLSRDELQGVVAHEFSHILHGDMRLNMRLIGLAYGILAISIVGRGLVNSATRRSGRSRKSGASGALIGVGLMLIGSIGVFFGRLIQAAVSRQREFLADAAGVQYTRNPFGLARALGRIAGSRAGSKLASHHASELGHLFFSNALGIPSLPAFATHPPLTDRIRRLGADPAEVIVREAPAEVPARPKEPPRPRVPADLVMHVASGMALATDVSVEALVGSVGNPGEAGVAAATRLLDSLPAELTAAVHDPERAPEVLLALLSPGDEGPAEVRNAVAALPRAARLPVVDLLMPALRSLPRERRAEVHAAAVRAIRADGHADLFEFAVYHIVRRQLAPESEGPPAKRREVHSVTPIAAEAALLISAVAWMGASSQECAEAAYKAGRARLPETAQVAEMADRSAVQLAAVDAALGRVRAASPGVRRRVLLAAATAAGQDGVLKTAEAEFVRATAEAIDCPLPLVFAQEAAPVV